MQTTPIGESSGGDSSSSTSTNKSMRHRNNSSFAINSPPPSSSSSSSFQAHTSNRAPIEKAWDILNDSDQVLNANALSAYLSSLGVFCADDLEFIHSDNLEILARDHLKIVGGKKLKKALNTLIA